MPGGVATMTNGPFKMVPPCRSQRQMDVGQGEAGGRFRVEARKLEAAAKICCATV